MAENSIKKSRIVFIDLMRAFAVLMMVQGHTVDSLLNNDYRTFDSVIYNFWFFMRGLTAPIFLFSSGTVFMYLFRSAGLPFKENPRVKKGIKRFLLLLALGYLLRYPTPYLIYFGNVTQQQWEVFFVVDVLHLIGISILFTIGIAWLAEKFSIRDYILFPVAAFISFALYPVCANIQWAAFLPVPLAGYFYQGTGSLFPLFPWTGYVFTGAVLGSYLAKNPNAFNTKKFSFNMAGFGLLFIAVSLLGNIIEVALYKESFFWTTSPNLIFFRVGIVLLLNSVVSFVALTIKNIHPLIIQVGRNTLPIYVVHLVILYGSPWTLGLYAFFAKSFNAWMTVGTAVLMISLMITMVQGFQLVKVKYKQKKFAPDQL